MNGPSEIQKLLELAMQFYHQERHQEALAPARQAVEEARRVLGERHVKTAEAENVLALVSEGLQDFRSAESLYQQALATLRALKGEQHPDYAATLSNLADLYRLTGQLPKAVPLMEQTVALLRRVSGVHPNLITGLSNLGQVYQEMGRHGDAEGVLLEALSLAEQRFGSANPEVAAVLGSLGAACVGLGRQDAAETHLRRKLDILRRAVGEEHPVCGRAFNDLGVVLRQRGRLEEAERCLRRAHDIIAARLGPDHPDTANVGLNLAGLLREAGRHQEAEDLFRRCGETLRRALGDDHPRVAMCDQNLAVLCRQTGRLAEAEVLYRKAGEVLRRRLGDEHPDHLATLENLGVLCDEQGRSDEAEALFRRVLDIRERTLGPDHPAYGRTLESLAGLAETRGDAGEAAARFERALELVRRAHGDRHPDVARALQRLGAFHLRARRFADAESRLREALEVWRAVSGDAHPEVATCFTNLGWLYKTIGDHDAAEQCCRQALKFCEGRLDQNHPQRPIILNNLGNLLAERGDLEGGARMLDEARKVWRTTRGEDAPEYATATHNAGNLLLRAGNYQEARARLEEALDIRTRVLGPGYAITATTLNSLAYLEQARGEPAAAEALYRRALDAMTAEHHPEDRLVVLYNLAALDVQLGRPEEARELMEQAIAIEDRTLKQVFAAASEPQRLMFAARLQSGRDLYLSLVVQRFAGAPEAVARAFDLVLRRKGLGAEAHAAQREAVLRGAHPELAPRLQRLAELRQRIARLSLAGPDPEGPEAYRSQLAEWHREREDIEAELARRIPDTQLDVQLRRADIRSVARALDPDATLVEIVRYQPVDFGAVPNADESRPAHYLPAHYLAFVLPGDPTRQVEMIELGDAEALDRLVAEYRSSLVSDPSTSGRDLGVVPRATAGEPEAGARLRGVLEPLLTRLHPGGRVVVAPDGDLSRLPFEVLPLQGDERIIDRYRISYLSSGRDLLRLVASPPAGAGLPLVVADPDFDFALERGGGRSRKGAESRSADSRLPRGFDWRGVHFTRLPGTRQEGERIAELLGVEPLLGAAALEGTVKSNASPRILHLATHGFFFENQPRTSVASRALGPLLSAPDPGGTASPFGLGIDNPLVRSMIALAGVNTWLTGGTVAAEAEDGLLSAEDVAALDLSRTQLVVLSACETGLGQVLTGEGVFGLRRAFTLAGARTLVMSLWKVPDEATAELMEDFYRRLLAGQPRADSLREAQLALRERYPHPLYWGAFVCQGDYGPLPVVPPAEEQEAQEVVTAAAPAAGDEEPLKPRREARKTAEPPVSRTDSAPAPSHGNATTPRRARGSARTIAPKIGRNDPCPCGSGKKYVKCHGVTARASGAPSAVQAPIPAKPPGTAPPLGSSAREEIDVLVDELRRRGVPPTVLKGAVKPTRRKWWWRFFGRSPVDVSESHDDGKQDPSALLGEATRQANLGDLQRARRLLLTAIRTYEDHADAHYTYGSFLFNFFPEDSLDEAETELLIALKLDRYQEGARQTLLRIYFSRARQEKRRGNWAAAIEQYDKAIEADPDQAESYNYRANARRFSVDPDKPFPPGILELALRDFDKALQLDPRNAEIYTNRGIVRRMTGDQKGAKADFDLAIEIDATDATYYINRGLLLESQHADAKAERDFARALSLAPSLKARLEAIRHDNRKHRNKP